MRPSSLPQAISEPDSDTAPMIPPSTAMTRMMLPCALWPNSSIAAIAAAAPPPMPLYSATICGIAVISTFLPLHQAQPRPTASATTPRMMLVLRKGSAFGFTSAMYRKATSTATTMPTPATTMPERAVTGDDMRLRP